MKSGRDWSCWESVCGWGVEWSCSSVRSMLDAPSPQENKDLRKWKMFNRDWNVSLWTPSGIPREQDKELTTT